MRSPSGVEAAWAVPLDAAGERFLENGFHFACLAFQRARQLKNGGRSSLDSAGHKYLWVAMHEVRTGMVTWDVTGKVD
jgi:DNA-directed RNA polymerase subunit K/omega